MTLANLLDAAYKCIMQCAIRFVHLQITSPKVKAHLEMQAVGVTMMSLNQGILSGIQFPLPDLPDLPTQRAIVADIEAEQVLVNANRELIRRMEAKVKEPVGLKGNRLQIRLDGPYFAAFLINRMTIDLQNRQNLSSPSQIFASIL